MTRPKTLGRYKCPHCQDTAVIYTSRKLSALVTEQYVHCTNPFCGFQFVAHTGIVRALRPSMTPNAEVDIPLVERRPNDIVVQRAGTACQTPDTAMPLPVPGAESPATHRTYTH